METVDVISENVTNEASTEEPIQELVEVKEAPKKRGRKPKATTPEPVDTSVP
jgi:hypothetical protein